MRIVVLTTGRGNGGLVAPDVGDGDCGVRGGDEGSLELRQKAACESVAAGVANLIMTLPEFAIQR